MSTSCMVGAVGVEPTTNALKVRCSTTELRPYSLRNILHEKNLMDSERLRQFRRS